MADFKKHSNQIIGSPGIFKTGMDITIYESKLKNFFVANTIDDDAQKRAVLLSSVTEDIHRVLHDLCAPNKPDDVEYETLMAHLNRYFKPIKSYFTARYTFYHAKRRSYESICQWGARVTNLASKCGFSSELTTVIRDIFVVGMNAGPVQTRLMEEDALNVGVTYSSLMEIARTIEDKQATLNDKCDWKRETGVDILKYHKKVKESGKVMQNHNKASKGSKPKCEVCARSFSNCSTQEDCRFKDFAEYNSNCSGSVNGHIPAVSKIKVNIQDGGLLKDTKLKVIKSTQKNNRKQKYKSGSIKKVNDQLSTPLSLPLKSDSLVHSPLTLDLDSLSMTQSESSNANESLSFSEPSTPIPNFVPLSVENILDSVTSNPLELTLKVDEFDEKSQLKFYRDTLMDSTTEKSVGDKISINLVESTTENNVNFNKDGYKSILVYVRNKLSNKSVSWKSENDLVQVSYFEHDETEKVNVTKNFKAMEIHERDIERQNFIAIRKTNSADNMEPKTAWRYLDDSLLVEISEECNNKKNKPGSGSEEKKKQSLGEQSVLQAIYFTRSLVPDSPEDPEQIEILPYSEPLNIPLEGMSGDKVSIFNYVHVPWPESKGDQPPQVVEILNKTPMSNITMYHGNQTNCNALHKNVMGMNSPNHMYVPPNQMMSNNQLMYSTDDQVPQWRQHPLQQQQINSPDLPIQQDQHCDQQHPSPNNEPPSPPSSHFQRDYCGSYGHIIWDSTIIGGNYNSYLGKMNRNNKRNNRYGPYNSGRVCYRLCKYYTKLGFCKNTNCAFLHLKN